MEFPRRVYLDRLSAGERAIHDAVQEVESMGADERLTRAVILLQQARDSVADFVDGVEHREPEHGGYGPFIDAGLVKCVECPACGFTFDARHVDAGGDGPPTYTCDCGYSADATT